jgi:hypothetical protein
MNLFLGKSGFFTTISIATILGLTIAHPDLAQSASLTTTFDGSNQQTGNMFDVTTFSNNLKVTSLEINVKRFNSAPGILDVYTKTGSYVGFETSAATWTKVSSVILNSVSPLGTPTFVDISDILLSANTVTGFYVTFANQTNLNGSNVISYTNGANIYTNSDLQITTGVGKGGTFGPTFSPRTWNGTINYETVNSQTVPEPMSILGTGAAFGLGVLIKKKRNTNSQK